ncbi:hypothetical protein vBSsoS008_022 [Shigella phage vB_SsoS_008]|nr:hypothetical protein vBSsoS008_022 [Shigella phage vB_SsoS_008]
MVKQRRRPVNNNNSRGLRNAKYPDNQSKLLLLTRNGKFTRYFVRLNHGEAVIGFFDGVMIKA